ncbi:MAG: glycosyltransferase [bacterium]
MTESGMHIAILGLSITSSWGNGHATTYRALVRELAAAGHEVLFLERDRPWYAENRDLPHPPFCRTELYTSLEELDERFREPVRSVELVVVGSYVPEGIRVGEWVVAKARGVTAFYDIDTPVTVARLGRGDCEYLSPDLVPRYDIYFSSSGGPLLGILESVYGSPGAFPLYGSVDPSLYHPQRLEPAYDLGYMGTYSEDRQPALESLLIEPARLWKEGRFAVAGSQYPEDVRWPENIERLSHLHPADHGSFYNRQRFTLNVTRADMVRAGYSPSVRLFEAAACGTPIVSDPWQGIDSFFVPGREILISRSPEETLRFLREVPEQERLLIGARARSRVLASHTAAHRARELVLSVQAARERKARGGNRPSVRTLDHAGRNP